MKTILITGSNGLLGQTLISILSVKNGIKLVATSKGANRYPLSDGYIYSEMDICESGQMDEVINYYQPDAIINTAALTNVDTCYVNHDHCWELNVNAVNNLIKVCERKNIHLIHLSTDFVFDGNEGPYMEDAVPNPISFYGESKLAAEQLIIKSSCRWTIIRTILVYGVTARMSRSNIVLWAKEALEKGEPIKVVDDQWRMPTLVEDLAEACYLIAEKEREGIFHISGSEMMSICELVYSVADFWGLDKKLIIPISSKSLNQTASRPAKTGFILKKAKSLLEYRPHSFKEGLAIVDKKIRPGFNTEMLD